MLVNPLAQEINSIIEQENPNLLSAMSRLGKALYFPKGILSQAAEASKKANKFNATIGIATEKGGPMHLTVIQETLTAYKPSDLYPYAPPTGKPALRQAWKEKMLKENPSLACKKIGLPIVTNALTHGLSIAADLFVDEGDPLILPDKQWDNYDLTFTVRRGAQSIHFPLYAEDGAFNVAGMSEALLSQKKHGKAILLLNFPINPTGYTPSDEDGNAIVAAITEAAESGMTVVVICDDAYFGLFFEESLTESLFGRLANIHPRIIPIKVDGATKENYVWGFRVGFITFASDSDLLLEALEKKTMSCIRSSISSSPHPSQSFILRALESPDIDAQLDEKRNILKRRANRVKVLLNNDRFDDAWTYYPFNSGYFMCLKLIDGNAEQLRLHLLDHYGVGTIAIGKTDLRIAFSCIEEDGLEELFNLIYQAVHDLRK